MEIQGFNEARAKKIEDQRAHINQTDVSFLGSDVQTELLNYRMSPKTPRSSGLYDLYRIST